VRRETSVSNNQPESQPVTDPDRLLLGAYLGHLLVPLVLLVDSLRAVSAGTAYIMEKGVVAIGAIWLVAGLGALALSRNRRRFLDRISGPLLAVYVFCFSVGLAELGLRVVIQSFNRTPLRFRPGTATVTHNLARAGLPGVPPTATFTTNRLGLRGPLPPSDGRAYKIITVGGSTTECVALDDSQDWSHLLMLAMNDGQKKYPVWVGNSGASGLTTVDHLACLRQRPVLSQADLLIFLIGVNDLQATVQSRGASSQKQLDYKARLFIAHAPPGVKAEGGLFRRAWLFAMARDIALRRWHSSPETDLLLGARERRAAGPIVPLPDLQLGRREYSQRVRALERECHARGLRCLFLTQPTLWRANLSPTEEHLLWFGWVGRDGFASAADLARAMDAFNQTLLSVCREDHLECYDLASAIPKDTSAFFDDDHFNISGARMVAQFLAARLLASPPFSGTAP